jgi:hypothetical protein
MSISVSANISYFTNVANSVLETNFSWEGNEIINIEWAYRVAIQIYNNLHSPKNGCRRPLSHRINEIQTLPDNISKKVVDTFFVDNLILYLKEQKNTCNPNTACTGRCNHDCTTTPNCTCGNCGNCNCGQRRCDCACACVGECECDCLELQYDCNCVLPNCNKNECVCGNCSACACCNDCECDCWEGNYSNYGYGDGCSDASSGGIGCGGGD